MLRKKMRGVAHGPRMSSAIGELANTTVDRRAGPLAYSPPVVYPVAK